MSDDQIRVFQSDNSGFGKRINFVDTRNIVVGFDWSQDCCEHFDYQWMVDGVPLGDKPEILEGWRFDPAYFSTGEDRDKYDEGAFADFRVIHEDGRAMILRLSNSHNGYYSHGFTLEVGGKNIRAGSL